MNEPVIEMTGFYLMTEEPRTHFPETTLPSVTERLFTLVPLPLLEFGLCVFLCFPSLKRINMMGVVFPSHFLFFQETLKRDERWHLPALCYKEVSLWWALLKLSSKFLGSPVRCSKDTANSLGMALICQLKT